MPLGSYEYDRPRSMGDHSECYGAGHESGHSAQAAGAEDEYLGVLGRCQERGDGRVRYLLVGRPKPRVAATELFHGRTQDATGPVTLSLTGRDGS